MTIALILQHMKNKEDHKLIREIKFWTSFGKDQKSSPRQMALIEMEDDHIKAILRDKITKGDIEKIFIEELNYRRVIEHQKLKEELKNTINKENIKKIKI